jgi:hypothetical protein
LLGLGLRFCLRGKYSDIFNFIFQINSVDLFGQCSQQQQSESRDTLAVILKKMKYIENNKRMKKNYLVRNSIITLIIFSLI